MDDRLRDIINYRIISSITNEDESMIDSILEEMDCDISNLNSFSSYKFKREGFILRGKIERIKDLKLLEKASLMFHEAIHMNLDKPVHYLMNLIKTNQFQFQFRNLDKLSIDDIKDIIKDQNLLQILEDIENEES